MLSPDDLPPSPSSSYHSSSSSSRSYVRVRPLPALLQTLRQALEAASQNSDGNIGTTTPPTMLSMGLAHQSLASTSASASASAMVVLRPGLAFLSPNALFGLLPRLRSKCEPEKGGEIVEQSNVVLLEHRHAQTSSGAGTDSGSGGLPSGVGVVVESTAALTSDHLRILQTMVDRSAPTNDDPHSTDSDNTYSSDKTQPCRGETSATTRVAPQGLVALRDVAGHCSDEIAKLCRSIKPVGLNGIHIHVGGTGINEDNSGTERHADGATPLKCNSFIMSLLSTDPWRSELRFVQQTMRRDKLHEFARHWLC
jgi:hypothetical protein